MTFSRALIIIGSVALAGVGVVAQQGGGRPVAFANFEVEIVTIDRRGFHPAVLVRKPGVFHLVVRDVTGSPLSDLELVDDKNDRKASPVVDKSKAKTWNGQLSLNPGVHILRFRNAPEIAMTITIDPNRR